MLNELPFESQRDILAHGLLLKELSWPEAMSWEEFEQILEGDAQTRTILMHCRPKDNFHLGNIWMLNKLQQFLDLGFEVYIVVILFDEELVLGSRSYIRLLETAVITKSFLSNFFGNHPSLHILTSQEMELSAEKIHNYHTVWKELVNQSSQMKTEDSSYMVNVLLRQKGLYWASPFHTFVAKCLSIYDLIRPSLVIFGIKHRDISTSFKLLAQRSDEPFPSIVYLEDLEDLTGSSGMGSMLSGFRKIEILDSELKIQHKISLMEPEVFGHWLDSAFDKVVLAGGRYDLHGQKIFTLDEFMSTFNMTQELYHVIALQYLLSSIMQAGGILRVPVENKRQWPVRKMRIRWSHSIYWSEPSFKANAEKIIKSLFIATNTAEISVRREFGHGFGGTRVFELVVFDSKGRNIIDSRIIKIGKIADVVKEKQNYDQYIKTGRSLAFVEAGSVSTDVEGMAGLLYADARRWLGIGMDDDILSLQEVCKTDISTDATRIVELIHNLFSHLGPRFYELGEFYRLRSYREFYNMILPYNLKLRANHINGSTLSCQGDTGEVCPLSPRQAFEVSHKSEWSKSVTIEISNLSQIELDDKRIRLTDPEWNIKVDVMLDDHSMYRQIKNLQITKFTVRAKIVETRINYLAQQCEALSVFSMEQLVAIGRFRLPNPLLLIESMLDKEYRYTRKSTIHGDLNLQNILTSGHNVVVIDYAFTGPNQPTAFDFIKLEVELRTHILSALLSLDGLLEIEQCLFSGKSHCSAPAIENALSVITEIREIASSYLRSPEARQYEFDDYYAGVYFYSLTTLKFAGLSDQAKLFAFTTAAFYGALATDYKALEQQMDKA